MSYNLLSQNLVFHSVGRPESTDCPTGRIPRSAQYYSLILVLLSVIHISILPAGGLLMSNKSQKDRKHNQQSEHKSAAAAAAAADNLSQIFLKEFVRGHMNPEWSHTMHPCHPGRWGMSHKKLNKIQKCKNGNGKNTSTVYHWNLGSKHWIRKSDQIQAMVNDIQPDYVFISEANIWEDDPAHICNIDGYEMVKPLSANTMRFCRIILLVKIGMQFQLLPHLMNTEVASNWFKTGTSGLNKVVSTGSIP